MAEFDVVRDAFETIYREDSWGNGSGPGSMPSSTIEYRSFLERFIHENSIRTVTDLGCGDWQFSRYINWSAVRYLGLDVAPSVVQRNNKRFASENITFAVSEDLDSLPGGDLLVAKEMLQHLPNAMVAAYLTVISQRYKFALLTNMIGAGDGINRDIEPGGGRPIKLEAAPFHAAGANVFVYHPRNEHKTWRNAVFLMLGEKRS